MREGRQQLLPTWDTPRGHGARLPLFSGQGKGGTLHSHKGEHGNDPHRHQQLQGDDGVNLQETRGVSTRPHTPTGAPPP